MFFSVRLILRETALNDTNAKSDCFVPRNDERIWRVGIPAREILFLSCASFPSRNKSVRNLREIRWRPCLEMTLAFLSCPVQCEMSFTKQKCTKPARNRIASCLAMTLAFLSCPNLHEKSLTRDFCSIHKEIR